MSIMNTNLIPKSEPKIARTWLAGGNKQGSNKCIVVTVPQEYRKIYNLEEPTDILVTPTDNGILISKLEIKR
jgi:hypothetical protein